jgi:hypothetical protein
MAPANLFSVDNVKQYPENKTGWDVYSLLFGTLPILAHRNYNDYDVNNEWHSTWSWTQQNIRPALPESLQLLRNYGALRHPKSKREKLLKNRLRIRLGPIVKRFGDRVRELGIRRMRGMHATDKRYPELLTAMASAVQEAGRLKSRTTPPMLGSKALHFLLPEFFPVWDTARIKNECLSRESMDTMEEEVSEIASDLVTDCEKQYAAYVHFFVRELSKFSNPQYLRIERACITRAVGSTYASWAKQVIDWHYDDMSTIVFEICLLGKHRRYIKPRK